MQSSPGNWLAIGNLPRGGKYIRCKQSKRPNGHTHTPPDPVWPMCKLTAGALFGRGGQGEAPLIGCLTSSGVPVDPMGLHAWDKGEVMRKSRAGARTCSLLKTPRCSDHILYPPVEGAWSVTTNGYWYCQVNKSWPIRVLAGTVKFEFQGSTALFFSVFRKVKN